jgi:hypothetical protein
MPIVVGVVAVLAVVIAAAFILRRPPRRVSRAVPNGIPSEVVRPGFPLAAEWPGQDGDTPGSDRAQDQYANPKNDHKE